MSSKFDGLAFSPADILLPHDCDLTRWAVVACDQYTSQPSYWAGVDAFVGNQPSTLHLVLPESRLEDPDVEHHIMDINNTMTQYLRDGLFTQLESAIIYVERRQRDGKIRRGLVGMVDLEQYDYQVGATTLIRATEGTIIQRIPPRVSVRKNAPIELPHVMMLADDPHNTVILPLASQTGDMTAVYDFDLMEGGGHISGWQLTAQQMEHVAHALHALAQPEVFAEKYGVQDVPLFLFAMGDGNHSLATAKECYQRQKKVTPPEAWSDLPARYALVELVNLHDEALEFEPIHRVVFDVEPQQLLTAFLASHPGAYYGEGAGHQLRFAHAGGTGTVTVPQPTVQLPVGTLQNFLDEYVEKTGGRIDYIHGEDVACTLAQEDGNIAFILDGMEKSQLFPTVIFDGVLPRKTFSMGEAHDKRFYLEARKIR